MLKRILFAGFLLCSALGCRSNDSSDPAPLYLSTRPPGARVLIDNVEFFTPCNLPSWISIEVPGQPPARLDVDGVAPANAPAAAFGQDWLMAGETP